MASTDIEPSEITKWDPGLTEHVMGFIRPLIKGYHRAEVRGLESFPAGGALVVSNHSGGLFPMDVPCSPPGSTRSSAMAGRSTRCPTMSSSPGRPATS